MSIVGFYLMALLILASAAVIYEYVSSRVQYRRNEQDRTDDLRVEYLRWLRFARKLCNRIGRNDEAAHKVALGMLLNDNEEARKRWERINGRPYPVR